MHFNALTQTESAEVFKQLPAVSNSDKTEDEKFMSMIHECVDEYCLIKNVREMQCSKYGLQVSMVVASYGPSQSSASGSSKEGTIKKDASDEGGKVTEASAESKISPLSFEEVRQMPRISDDEIFDASVEIVLTQHGDEDEGFFKELSNTQLFEKYVESCHKEIYPVK
mmetsp:Transcript_34751/g.90123  ORF Transcript_34751/g.90123 Transcript_34751/m.90123 type:complete len:168 (+) Transcript_34751:1307-1810(+)